MRGERHLYAYRAITRRLQPVKKGDRVVFVGRDEGFSERGYVRITVYEDGGELYVDYFEVAKTF